MDMDDKDIYDACFMQEYDGRSHNLNQERVCDDQKSYPQWCMGSLAGQTIFQRD